MEGRSMKEKLEKFVAIRTGKLDANASSENGKYPFFTCSITPLKIDTYSYDCECVLVAGNGDLNVKYYKGKFDAYQRTYIIESSDKGILSVKYLYLFLEYYIEELRRLSVGGVIKYIRLSNLTDALINVPAWDIQKEITEKLEKLLNIISKRKEQLAKLDALAKSRFLEMFGDPIQNDKNWENKILNDLTDVRDGTHDSPKYHNEGYPFITSKNLINGNIDFSTAQYISKEDYEHFCKRSNVDDGDILMPMIGTIGGAVLVKKDRDFSIKNLALIKFNKNMNQINSRFILYILNSDAMNLYFDRVKSGGTQKFIGLGLIRNLPIINPPILLQNQFTEFVEELDKSKFRMKKCLRILGFIRHL